MFLRPTLRPRATAYADTLVLRNPVSELHVPLADVDAVTVRQTLNVWVGDERYVCVGIGQSSRELLKRRSRGPMSFLGLHQVDDRMGLGHLRDVGATTDYASFVERRITELAQAARQARDPRPSPGVRRLWAVPELAALSMLGAALALTLVL